MRFNARGLPHVIRRRAALAALLSSCAWAASASAQDFPSKPIRLLVGYATGGGVDATARIIAPRLAEALNTTVVVENRPGAGGTIASDAVAKAAPDGYTLVYAPASAMTTAPQAMPRPPYHPLNDFAAVGMVGMSPLLISVHPSLGVTNLKELIKVSQTRKINLASGGVGGLAHFVVEMLSGPSKGNIVHIPYKGGGPAMVDAIAGHIDGVVTDFPPVIPMLRDKRLVPVAVTSDKRVDFLPAVQAANEDLRGFVAWSWYGVFAPAQTPPAIVDKINAALATVVARPDVLEQLKSGAVVPAPRTSPAAFRKFVAEDYARWGKLVRERNLVMSN